MDQISKALNKLSDKNRKKIKSILLKLKAGSLSGLDIKKLKDINNIYRVRAGNFRIIYQQEGSKIIILKVSRRNEATYK